MEGLTDLLRADAYRITGTRDWRPAARQFVLGETFRYNVALRLVQTTRSKPGRILAKLWLRRLRVRLGINIPAETTIGPGLLIGHAGGIVVSPYARIGRDCNLSHNVTIGVARGKRAGAPVIGDRVYIGSGAVVVGGITVGDDAAIGANAVVINDVPARATAVGNPARTLPNRGSSDYVHRTTAASGGLSGEAHGVDATSDRSRA